MPNKVEFGISNLHVGTYNIASDGSVTLGAPYHQKGAVGFAPSPNSERNPFSADDIIYWSDYSDEIIEGDLTVALFDDTFKTQFLGYVALTNGGLASVKNATKPNIYIAFEVKGDVEKRRVIFYNCSTGPITREYATIEDGTRTPVTESIPVTVIGDETSGALKAVLKPGDTGYDTLFTAPTAPVIAP